ncbi:MAG: hypothetical protein U9R37_04515 [Campylobacterota bacterium]|nr:hypothetical protein [Campylobacterota bacterium]
MKNSVDILSNDLITTLSIKVTEEINKKDVLKFIKTTIINKHLTVENSLSFYYTYIKEILSYEIIVVDTNQIDFTIEPFLFLEDERNELEKSIVFMTKEYFVYYKNRELIFLKKIKNEKPLNIKAFVEHTFKITLNNIYEVDDNELNKLRELNNQKKSNPKVFKKLQENNGFRTFIYIFILTTTLFLYLLFNDIKKDNNTNICMKNSYKLEKQYHNLTKASYKNDLKPTKYIKELFKYLKIDKIKVEKIQYANKKIKINISHKSKEVLMNFLTKYNKKIKINYISSDLPNSRYNMEFSVAI